MPLIRAALSIRFSVRELCEVFRERDSGAAPCPHVRELAAEKLVAVEARIRELQSCRRELRKTLAHGLNWLQYSPRRIRRFPRETKGVAQKPYPRARCKPLILCATKLKFGVAKNN